MSVFLSDAADLRNEAVENVVYGLNGNDRIFSSTLSPDLYGGEGSDFLAASNNAAFVDSYGGAGNDTLHGSVNGDQLSGEDGNDLIVGGEFTYASARNTGAITPFMGELSGADRMYGGAGVDAVYGFDGDDIMYGEDGDDGYGGGTVDFITPLDDLGGFYGAGLIQAGLFGGTGHDTIDGGLGRDLIDGGDGADTLIGGGGADYLIGGNDGDVMYAVSGGDTMYGQAGGDVLVGGQGNDTMVGGDGNDTIWGFDGSFEYMVGDAGNDTIAFNNATGQAYGGAGADSIVGGHGADYMQGDAGDDFLFGFGGNDTLVGGTGVDSLSAGAGVDFILGGLDADTFSFNDGAIIAGEFDQVGDFQDGVDFVVLPASVGAGGYSVVDTGLGAFLSVNVGSSPWGVFFSGATAAQVSDQILLL